MNILETELVFPLEIRTIDFVPSVYARENIKKERGRGGQLELKPKGCTKSRDWRKQGNVFKSICCKMDKTVLARHIPVVVILTY